jgi:hypothetical protein
LGEAWKVTASVAVDLFKYIACHSIASILAARDTAMLLVTTYPLWTGGTAVDAAVVLICLCDLTQFGAGLRVDLPHFTHLDCVVCGLLSVVGMRKRGVLLLARESGRDGGETAGGGGWAAWEWYAVLLVVDVVGIQSRGMLVGVSVGEEGYSMTRTVVKAPVAIRKNRNTLALVCCMRPAFRAFGHAPALQIIRHASTLLQNRESLSCHREHALC